MDTTPSRIYHPATPPLGRWLAVGFLAGALSVLIFHQGAVALMHALHMTERTPYAMQATQPFGVPQVWSLAFWGGVWGLLFAALLRHLDDEPLVLISLLLGAALPTLVAWFVVAPLKGQPIAAGFEPTAMAFGIIVNAAWGLGTGIGLALLGRRRPVDRRNAPGRRARADRRRTDRRRGAELAA